MRKHTRFGEICINYTTDEELFLPYVTFGPDTHFTPSTQTFACSFQEVLHFTSELCIDRESNPLESNNAHVLGECWRR